MNTSRVSRSPGQNRRIGADRVATMRLATIRLGNGDEIPCVVRDLSATGAKLAVAQRYRLTAAFALVVRGRETAFQVRRVWQRGNFAGVALVADGAAGTASPAKDP